MVRHLTYRSARWRSCRQMFLILLSHPTGRLILLILVPRTALFEVSTAAGISSEDWRRWSSEASREQLLGHDQSTANQSMVLLNSGPYDYCRLFILVVDTLSTVSLNSENWFWRELVLSWKDLAVNSFRIVHLSTAKQTWIFNCCIQDVGLCCVSNLFLDILLNNCMTLWFTVAKMRRCKLCHVFWNTLYINLGFGHLWPTYTKAHKYNHLTVSVYYKINSSDSSN